MNTGKSINWRRVWREFIDWYGETPLFLEWFDERRKIQQLVKKYTGKSHAKETTSVKQK